MDTIQNQYLNLYGPINELGYGTFVRGLIQGLYQTGNKDFFLNIIGNIETEDQLEAQQYSAQCNRLWRRSAPGIAIWHEFDLCKFSGNKLIGFPIFETTGFQPLALNYLSQMDSVFVMSHWAKGVVETATNRTVPVYVIPGAGLLPSFNATASEINIPKNKNAFTFLYVGKFEKRKSTIEVLQAYLKAFRETREETRLLLHCYNPFDKNFLQTIQHVFLSNGLRIVPSTSQSSIVGSLGNCIVEVPLGRIPKMQIAQLYRYAHIGVFPSRAEGWNLPLMEALQSGLPCITTNYSAHTEYANKEYGFNENLLLNNLKMTTAVDNVWFHGNRGEWADISVSELAEKMLSSYKNYDKIIKEFNNEKLVNTFTWKNTAIKFLNALNNI